MHLAWQIQPSHDQRTLHRTNVGGSRAVIEATVRAGVPALVYASSVGAYAPGPKDHPVSERWPATGVPGSSYSRDKAEVEALLDGVEREHPQLRVVRLRPGLIFQRDAGTEITRYFLGPLAPVRLLRYGRIPLVPANRRLRMQAVHADDVADAYARAVLGDARGAFNVAADPVLTPELVARHFHGWTVPVAAPVLRAAAALTWRARLQPVDAGWVELGLNAPLMSSERAETELGWHAAGRRGDRAEGPVAGMAGGDAHRRPAAVRRRHLPGRPAGLLQGPRPRPGQPLLRPDRHRQSAPAARHGRWVVPVTVGGRAPRKKMPGKPAVSKPVARVAAQGRALDRHRAGAVVADEEDRAAALVGVVVLDDRCRRSAA